MAGGFRRGRAGGGGVRRAERCDAGQFRRWSAAINCGHRNALDQLGVESSPDHGPVVATLGRSAASAPRQLNARHHRETTRQDQPPRDDDRPQSEPRRDRRRDRVSHQQCVMSKYCFFGVTCSAWQMSSLSQPAASGLVVLCRCPPPQHSAGSTVESGGDRVQGGVDISVDTTVRASPAMFDASLTSRAR